MAFKVDVNINADALLKQYGLTPKSKAQEFFANEIIRASDPYVPFDTGVLKDSVRNEIDAISYNTPYAQYLWYGKLMVDPITKKGAFFSPNYGFWSRPNTPKELTDIDLHFNNGALRGAHWVERAWIDHKNDILNSTRDFIIKTGGK